MANIILVVRGRGAGRQSKRGRGRGSRRSITFSGGMKESKKAKHKRRIRTHYVYVNLVQWVAAMFMQLGIGSS